MNHQEARKIIRNILQVNVKFEGHFNNCFDNIKETQQKEFFIWVKACKENCINPIQSKKNREIIGFIRKIGSNLRVILTKRKNSYFIALFLDKHKYYEAETKKLGF